MQTVSPKGHSIGDAGANKGGDGWGAVRTNVVFQRERKECFGMGACTEGPSRSGGRLTFLGVRNLVAWLESPLGAEVRKTLEDRWLPDLEGVLWTTEEGRRLQAEVLLRANKEMRAIVVIEPYKSNEALLRVYGPKELHVKVITLPMARCPTVETQRALEQLVELELPWAYKPWYYPSAVRVSATVEIQSAETTLNKMRQVEMDKAVMKSLNEVTRG